MTASLSLDEIKKALTDKGFTGNQDLIESTYKALSLPLGYNYLGAPELDALAIKVEIAALMGYSPSGEVQMQSRSSVKSASAEFYKFFFVQAVQKNKELA